MEQIDLSSLEKSTEKADVHGIASRTPSTLTPSSSISSSSRSHPPRSPRRMKMPEIPTNYDTLPPAPSNASRPNSTASATSTKPAQEEPTTPRPSKSPQMIMSGDSQPSHSLGSSVLHGSGNYTSSMRAGPTVRPESESVEQGSVEQYPSEEEVSNMSSFPHGSVKPHVFEPESPTPSSVTLPAHNKALLHEAPTLIPSEAFHSSALRNYNQSNSRSRSRDRQFSQSGRSYSAPGSHSSESHEHDEESDEWSGVEILDEDENRSPLLQRRSSQTRDCDVTPRPTDTSPFTRQLADESLQYGHAESSNPSQTSYHDTVNPVDESDGTKDIHPPFSESRRSSASVAQSKGSNRHSRSSSDTGENAWWNNAEAYVSSPALQPNSANESPDLSQKNTKDGQLKSLMEEALPVKPDFSKSTAGATAPLGGLLLSQNLVQAESPIPEPSDEHVESHQASLLPVSRDLQPVTGFKIPNEEGRIAEPDRNIAPHLSASKIYDGVAVTESAIASNSYQEELGLPEIRSLNVRKVAPTKHASASSSKNPEGDLAQSAEDPTLPGYVIQSEKSGPPNITEHVNAISNAESNATSSPLDSLSEPSTIGAKEIPPGDNGSAIPTAEEVLGPTTTKPLRTRKPEKAPPVLTAKSRFRNSMLSTKPIALPGSPSSSPAENTSITDSTIFGSASLLPAPVQGLWSKNSSSTLSASASDFGTANGDDYPSSPYETEGSPARPVQDYFIKKSAAIENLANRYATTSSQITPLAAIVAVKSGPELPPIAGATEDKGAESRLSVTTVGEKDTSSPPSPTSQGDHLQRPSQRTSTTMSDISTDVFHDALPMVQTFSTSSNSEKAAESVTTPKEIFNRTSKTDAKARAAAFVADLKRARAAAALAGSASSQSPGPSVQILASNPDSKPSDVFEVPSASSEGGHDFSFSEEPELILDPLPKSTKHQSSNSIKSEATGNFRSGVALSNTPSGHLHTDPIEASSRSNDRQYLQHSSIDSRSESQIDLQSAAAELARNRYLPAACNLADIRSARSTAEKLILYAEKINAFAREDSGLNLWIECVHESRYGSSRTLANSPPKNRHKHSASASSIAFPPRGDSSKAREISIGDFGPSDMIPTVPYPGVLPPHERFNSAKFIPSSQKPSFFGGLGRKGPKRGPMIRPHKDGNYLVSPLGTIGISLPQNPSSRSLGSRSAGVPRPSMDDLSESHAMNKSPPLQSVSQYEAKRTPYMSPEIASFSSYPSPLPPASRSPDTEDKLIRLQDILPNAERSVLLKSLDAAGGDEVQAISIYLSSGDGQ